MKKTLILISLSLLAAMSVLAQSRDNEDNMFDSGTNKPSFGVRIAWNLNSPTTNLYKPFTPYHSGSGLSAGAFFNMPLYKNLYFEPGLSVFYNTMIINYSIPGDLLLDYPLPPEGSLRNSGIRLPLNFGFRFDVTDDVALSVYTGPQFNVGVTLKEYNNITKSVVNLYDKGWHRFDAQWVIGVRFHYSDNWIADISCGIGMTNMLGKHYPDADKFRRNSFSIGVGYIF